MMDFKEIAYEQARNFRDQYQLGHYCGHQLLEVLGLIEQSHRIDITLIRTPLKNTNLAGFIGYKNETFVIVTNTNLSYGNERFTIAHEIYHLLQNRVQIKKNPIIEDIFQDNELNTIEIMANCFAAELLMPKESLQESFYRVTDNNTKEVSYSDAIVLQHMYGVDYIALTRRLYEVSLIDFDIQQKLENILEEEGALEKITKSLGHDQALNKPSKETVLLQKDLKVIKDNYDKGDTSFDDLVRIFGYLGCEPEKFGYENENELTEEAKDFMNYLLE